MTSRIRIFNRVTGGDGSPGGTGDAGNLALNFDPAARAANGGTPKFFASDGASWVLVNPPPSAPTVGNVSLPGGTPGSATGIGAAWTAYAPKPTDPIIIAGYAGTAYVKIGSGGADGDWTVLGSVISVAGVTLAGGTSGSRAGIGNAWNALPSKPGDDIVVADYASNFYIKTGPGTADGDWFALSNVHLFADAAEIKAGTVNDKPIAPDQLSLATITAPTPTGGDAGLMVRLNGNAQFDQAFIPKADDNDIRAGTEDGKFLTPLHLFNAGLASPSATPGGMAGHYVRLDGTGHVHPDFLTVKALTYFGNVDITQPENVPAKGYNIGDFASIGVDGVVDPTWTIDGIKGNQVTAGDLLIWNGASWSMVSRALDTSSFVKRSGANTVANDMTMTWAAPIASTVIIDGADPNVSLIDNVTINEGQF